MNVYLVRHGTTESNEERKYYGAYESELTLKGIEEAKALKEKLNDINFDAVYVSSKKRSFDTAKIVLGNDKEFLIDKRLDERNFGIFENKTYEEIKMKFEKELKHWEEDWRNYKIPDGESALETYERVKDFMHGLENINKENVLLVTHGGFIRNVYCYILGSIDFFWKFSSKNGDLSIVKYEYNNWYIDSITHT